MYRSVPFIVVIALACGGGGSPDPAGPKAVATVSVAATSTTITVGQQVTLTFAAFDASGGSVTGRSATWASSASQVASVSPAGVVTGVAAGTATITATVDGRVGSQTITVLAAGTDPCASAPALSLSIGETRILTGTSRATICLTAGTSGTEYMLLAFNNSLDTTGRTLAAGFSATGTVQATGSPAAAALVVPAPFGGIAALAQRPARNRGFEQELRTLERRELGPHMRAGSRAAAYERMRAAAAARATSASATNPGTGSAALRGVTGVPAVGTLVTLNTRSNSGCSNPTFNTGRVVAVSAASIIIADTLAPAGGFTTAEYQAFGTTFDTLVFPLDTAAFGAPSDLDANGRVVIFFTQAVNQLTARSAASVVGGFFFARDLFPIAGNTALGLQPCASSNEAEMFYVPVVDPAEVYNQYFKSKATMTSDLLGTLAHEFQHLINAGRRAYVNNADDFELTWLDEGLAHIAEELLYFRVSGLPKKADLTLAQITANATLVAAVNPYQLDNLLRLAEYLKAPEVTSPYKSDAEDLATRGASWQFLRYVVDIAPAAENTYFRALVNARTNGMANMTAVVAPLFSGGMPTAFRSWALAQFLDNTGLSADPTLQFRSWNYRSVLTNQLGFTGYPLKPRVLVDGAPQSFVLPAGGAGYMRFRVNGGASAAIVSTALPSAVDLVLVRTQ